jgi:type I restriction enzyme R subunit
LIVIRTGVASTPRSRRSWRVKPSTPEQTSWLDRIRDHLRQNLSIERDDFELIPVFADAGGWGAIRRAFGDTKLDALIHDLNEAIAA